MSPEGSSLEQLRRFTAVVADTGDFESIIKFKPQDATTNPSLLLNAAKLEKYEHLVRDAISYAEAQPVTDKAAEALDKLIVNFGVEILKVIPGRVSTEVDASLSYDTEASIAKALKLVALYEEAGVERKRVLIKVASTWEGIQAARQLEKQHNIHCNLTLLFSLVQAAVCADAGVTLISPFVGRILDWHKKNTGFALTDAAEDPGVRSVKNIYAYLKKHAFATTVMGASFRSKEEIVELAGIDLLTISPVLLEELANSNARIEPKLTAQFANVHGGERLHIDAAEFKKRLEADSMASELLRDGIRKFDEDGAKMKKWLASLL